MDEQKKFLDFEGLKILWTLINMQDYPNNEMLKAVIESIDEVKADRNEIPAIDTTLSIEGAAADAKATRTAIDNIITEAQCDTLNTLLNTNQ